MRGAARAGALIERRREEINRVGEQAAKNGIVEGKVLLQSLTTTGQAFVQVNFPVAFTEEPIFTFGYALEENEAIVGVVPSCTSIVTSWVKQERSDDRVYWVGAVLGVRIEGWEGILLWAHYSFSGTSLQNPIQPTGTMGETL